MRLTKSQMDIIGHARGIHPYYRRHFLILANEGQIINNRFGERLRSCRNYQQACKDVMHLLSQEESMPFDFMGNEIRVGCTCAYPMRKGSKMWLTTIKVDAIEKVGVVNNQPLYTLLGYDSTGRRTRTRNIQNCIVVLL